MSDTDAVRLKQLQRLFDAFNAHDGDAVMACMTKDVVFDAAVGPEIFGRRFSGAADVQAVFEKTWGDMPDVSWQCTRHAVFADRGLSEWIFCATTADGKVIEVEGCDLFVFRGDLICEKSAFRKDRPLQAHKAAAQS